MNKYSFAVLLSLLAFAACEDTNSTLHPDYAIRVIPNDKGGIAVQPACPSWSTETKDPFDNQPDPQFGCATARNLAAMVDRPEDLIQGRDLGDARGGTLVGAVRRYDNNQPRGLIIPAADSNQAATTTAPVGNSSMSGDETGGKSGGSSSSSAAPAP